MRTEAWKESMKRIEDGERRHRIERKALEHYEAVRRSEAYKTTPYVDTWPLLIKAGHLSDKLAEFAAALEDTGYQAIAIEVRRFNFAVVEPHTGRQCP